MMDSVQTAWQANLKVNMALLNHLTPEMLEARTPGGGFSVAQHLAHIVGVTNILGLEARQKFGETAQPLHDQRRPG